MKKLIKKIVTSVPYLEKVALPFYRRCLKKYKPFMGSQEYWMKRYRSGFNSGQGSYGNLARFKAEIINKFVLNHKIMSIIEHGCGDGAQLGLADYRNYIGFDISEKCITTCKKKYASNRYWEFIHSNAYSGQNAQLSISLDVIYHLTEDGVFNDYMNRLFQSSQKYVIVYSSNRNTEDVGQSSHVRHRKFTDWIEKNKNQWKLIEYIPNRYPQDSKDTNNTSFADFYIFEMI